MELVLDIVIDAAKDTLALVPFLFVTFALLAVFELAAGDKIRSAIQRAGAAGPVVGAIAGIVPQCGFSAMGATLYAGRVITLGTLVAVFLSTSDEMLPLLVAEQVDLGKMTFILLTKAVVAVVSGMAIDLALRGIRKSPRLHATLKRRVLGPGMSDEASVASAVEEEEEEDDPAWNAVSEVCALRRLGPSGYPGGEFEVQSYDAPPSYQYSCGCGCEEVDPTDKRAIARFALRSALSHTVKVTAFIFLVTVALVAILDTVGEPVLSQFLASNEVLAVFASALVALIPNCAASVVITQLYLEGVLAFGPMMAGSLVGVGVGFLVLFSANRSVRENVAILGMLYVLGVFWGIVLMVLGL